MAAARASRRSKTTDGSVVKDQIELDSITLDSDVQPRESMSTTAIKDYAESMQRDVMFPDVIIYRDPETGVNIAADGWHRINAAKEAGRTTINAEIREGSKRDAILFSVGANAANGMRPSNEDKRRSVLRLLDDEEWSQWSDSAIAERVQVSQPFVSNLRKLRLGDTANGDGPRMRKGRSGTVMDVSNIGGKAPGRPRKVVETEDEPTNGHAPVSLVPDRTNVDTDVADIDVDLFSDDQELTVEAFAKQFAKVMLGIEANGFEAADVLNAMDTDLVDQLSDKWDGIISALDKYSDVMEAMMEEAPA